MQLVRCLGICETKLGPQHGQVAYTLHELGVCVRPTGRLEEAEKLLRRCLKIKEARLASEHLQVTHSL